MVRIKHLRGFLLVAAIVVIVIAGFYGLVFSHMLSSGLSANANYTQAMQSYYIAQAGLDRGLYAVNAPYIIDNPNSVSNPTARLSCGIVSTTDFSNGQFAVNQVTRKTTRTSLRDSISAVDTTIPLQSTNGLTAQGRIYIGQEAVDYGALATCAPNNQPCLTGISRGANQTVASPHDNGTLVSQFACQLKAKGGVSTINSSIASSSVSAETDMALLYAAGQASGRTVTFTHWNTDNNNQWTAKTTQSSAGNRNNIYGIAAAGPNYVLAVGQRRNDNSFGLWQWDPAGNIWQESSQPSVAQSNYRQDINAVSMVSEKEAWAVGNRGGGGSNRRWTILRWDGSNWCAMTPNGACAGKEIPSDDRSSVIKNLRAVSVIDTNNDGLGDFGFAVGDNGRILEYDGTDWTQISSPTSTRIRSVIALSQNEAWACGDSGKVYRWNGSSWSQIRDLGGQQLYAITAIDTDGNGYANVGWVVGRQSNNGRAYRFLQLSPGTTSWFTHNPSGDANRRLRGVAMQRTGDVWAVGNNGRAIHWDGSSWARISADTNRHLFAVTLVGPRAPKARAFSQSFN